MQDFYVYFELPEGEQVGIIKAISPRELPKLEDGYQYLRIEPKLGLQFISGKESLSHWKVGWNSTEGAMEFVRIEQTAPPHCRFARISEHVKDPQIMVTWRPKKRQFLISGSMNVAAVDDAKLTFFVTEPDDPNVMHYFFSARLRQACLSNWRVDLEDDVVLPKKFSIYTRYIMDKYKLVIER